MVYRPQTPDTGTALETEEPGAHGYSGGGERSGGGWASLVNLIPSIIAGASSLKASSALTKASETQAQAVRYASDRAAEASVAQAEADRYASEVDLIKSRGVTESSERITGTLSTFLVPVLLVGVFVIGAARVGRRS